MVVFDFDKTLTNADTLKGFYNEFRSDFYFYFKKLILIFAAVLYKCSVINNDRLKKIGVSLFLKGKKVSEIDVAGRRYAKKIPLNKIYFEEYLQTSKDNRMIVSASFQEYLKYVFPEERIIASSLSYDSNLVKGLAENLYGKTKREFLIKCEINFIERLYTDSYSDRFLMEISKEVFLVKREKMFLIK